MASGFRTYVAKPGEVDRRWLLIDANGKILGRLATRIARFLQGKHKPVYTPHVDTGDFVVVVNAERIVMTGKKMERKPIRRWTGYAGGLREITPAKLLEKRPESLIEMAVRRMLPKSKLGVSMFSKLKVYRGADHPHGAQNPEKVEV
ncbi:MAG: 50S ribosomal protein L13 [Planctomycetota bacterium]